MTDSFLEPTLAPADRKRIFDFFWLFSRFEYGLKNLGYGRSNEKGHVTGVHWIKAGDRPGWSTLDHEVRASPRARYVLDCPPKQLAVEAGLLVWVETRHDDHLAIRHTCQVRNNLFHGGKFIGGPVAGTERDRELVDAATEVLMILGRLDSELWQKVKEHS